MKTKIAKKNWWWARDEIFDQWGPLLGSNGLTVYFCLCRHANADAKCWPSFKRLAQKCGIHRNTVIRYIKLLESYQLIRRTLRLSDDGDPDTNTYTILDLPDPPISKGKKFSVVAEDNHPSRIEQSQVVAVVNDGSGPELPKGNVIKETNLKETQLRTPTTGVVSEETSVTLENSSYIEKENKKPTIDLEASDGDIGNSGGLTPGPLLGGFTSEQQQQVAKLLKNVPVEGQQSVLSEFDKAFKKGKIRSPWNYLSTLTQKFKSGELVMTSSQDEQRPQCEMPLNAQNRVNKHDEKLEQCPYCDYRGVLLFELGNRVMPTNCDHNAERILTFAKTHQARILSMK